MNPRNHPDGAAQRRRLLAALAGATVVLATGALAPARAADAVRRPRRQGESTLGLRVDDLDADAPRALGVAGGVSVVHVTGLASVSGLRIDDVIVAVDGQAVRPRPCSGTPSRRLDHAQC